MALNRLAGNCGWPATHRAISSTHRYLKQRISTKGRCEDRTKLFGEFEECVELGNVQLRIVEWHDPIVELVERIPEHL